MSRTAISNLSESYPAVATSIGLARRRLRQFAAALGASDDELDAIALAVSEALTNVVVHAYRNRREGRIDLVAALAGEELWVLVADDGEGLKRRADSPGLGMGLAMIAAISDGMEVVSRGGGGTEVRMRFCLRAAASGPAQGRGSVASASSPASSRFSTTA